MYIKDDICYASEPVDEIKVLEVKPLRGRILLLTFNTGEKKLFDTTQLTGTEFTKLDNESIYMNPVLFRGIVTWKDGEIDIAPETLYFDGYDYQEDNVFVS